MQLPPITVTRPHTSGDTCYVGCHWVWGPFPRYDSPLKPPPSLRITELLIQATSSGMVYIWDVGDLDRRPLRIHNANVDYDNSTWSVSVAPRSRRIILGANTHTLQEYDLDHLLEPPRDGWALIPEHDVPVRSDDGLREGFVGRDRPTQSPVNALIRRFLDVSDEHTQAVGREFAVLWGEVGFEGHIPVITPNTDELYVSTPAPDASEYSSSSSSEGFSERPIRSIAAYVGHDHNVPYVEYDQSERLALSASIDGSIIIWSTTSQLIIGRARAGEWCWSAKFFPKPRVRPRSAVEIADSLYIPWYLHTELYTFQSEIPVRDVKSNPIFIRESRYANVAQRLIPTMARKGLLCFRNAPNTQERYVRRAYMIRGLVREILMSAVAACLRPHKQLGSSRRYRCRRSSDIQRGGELRKMSRGEVSHVDIGGEANLNSDPETHTGRIWKPTPRDGHLEDITEEAYTGCTDSEILEAANNFILLTTPTKLMLLSVNEVNGKLSISHHDSVYHDTTHSRVLVEATTAGLVLVSGVGTPEVQCYRVAQYPPTDTYWLDPLGPLYPVDRESDWKTWPADWEERRRVEVLPEDGSVAWTDAMSSSHIEREVVALSASRLSHVVAIGIMENSCIFGINHDDIPPNVLHGIP